MPRRPSSTLPTSDRHGVHIDGDRLDVAKSSARQAG
jgi:hypothetical protein